MNIFTEIPTNGGSWKQKYGEAWKKQIEKAKAKFGDAIEAIHTPWDYPTDVPIFFVKKSRVVDFLAFLKSDSDCAYQFLSDLTATDEGGDPRFEVVYNLFARDRGYRIRVKCRVAENEEVPTLSAVWKGADWAEREVFDMYGIRFTGHPNLRRILLDYRWEGFPLRKDYPLDGYQLFPDAEPPDPERLK
jgi:NADH-quinone oxidoreductase subunit C